jgi:hypothetical protein
LAEGTQPATNFLSFQRQPLRDGCETLRKFDAHSKISRSAEPEVIPETVDLMHALMQDGHNPDVAIQEMTPVDEMALVPKEEPFNTKLSRNRF